ncbi:MAG: hypothetical protein K2N51_18325 [Lachnospiraceae bacterium]|nr:hypothetical protein [Lachnospiraceae bacterium]
MAIAGVNDYINAYATSRTSYNMKGNSRLSGTAQSYLSDLKQKYSDVNIMVADFGNEKQSDAYMLGSRGYNNVAISASVVEKMATDPQAAEKYEKVVSGMSGNAERIEKFAQENNDEILGAGVVIDKNGKVSYWMVGRSKDTMENPGTVYKEKVQKQLEEKQAKKKEEKLKEKRIIKAETAEKLLEKRKAAKTTNVVSEGDVSSVGADGHVRKITEEKGVQMNITI